MEKRDKRIKLLENLKQSLNSYGKLREEDLALLRCYANYRDENLQVLDKFLEDPAVMAYILMIDEINAANEALEYVKKCGCEHILVKDGDNCTCVRCSSRFDLSKDRISLDSCILPIEVSYDEARELYDKAVFRLGSTFCDSYEIISEMKKIHQSGKVYKK